MFETFSAYWPHILVALSILLGVPAAIHATMTKEEVRAAIGWVGATFTSFSYWSTTGSDRVEPCLFVTPGMPPAAASAALLDGLWEHWEWSVPVRPIAQGQ